MLKVRVCATIMPNVQECIVSLQARALSVHAYCLSQDKRGYVGRVVQDFGSNSSTLGSELGLWA